MDMFSALAEPRRRSIIELLAANGQLSATAIARNFRISMPAISQHLKVLREAKLVHVEKKAQQRMYQLNPTALHEIELWAKQTSHLWNERFDTLATVLAAEQIKNKGVIYERKK